ncbi:proton-conducting transporter transmembrane domain-containing protein [Actinomadura macrotermitis]|uniref:NAD(P)H-quinone oxidoreductase subunit 2 n=1 Tax=Actinomadura macrotermitis TaxID=2585200 RepID=A0A7K0C391_9ACTN|nr:proton-conducting transporter membrane subunit [Actinomadura macrotermitis]MQY07893.1 NAD(P)H-quinone oxidoreductase subunit 2 [Actinomadura macrotermitis]
MTALLLPALPIAVGMVLIVAGFFPGRRLDRVAPGLAVTAALGTLVLAVAAAWTRPSARFPLFGGLPAGLAVDGSSAALVVTVAAVSLAVLVFAAGEFAAGEARARFFGLMLVFTGAMLVTVTATGLAVLLMGWEVMGAMSYALIGFWWRDPGRVRAAGVSFLTTRAGDLGLYLAAGAALAGTGSLELSALAGADEPWRDLVAAGVVLASLGKSAQLPFSFWLSRAMAGPSPVSALLHSATMVAAGAYLLLRLQPLLHATGWAAPLVAWSGALTALLLGAVALAQRDLKQLLAASTCAQIGFMVLAAGTGTVAGGAAHLVAHAAVKSLLFLCAGAWLTALGTKALDELHGAARRYRLVGVTFAVGALALAGVPPLSLWATKGAVLAAARDTPALYVVGLAAGLLSAGYAARALVAVWRPADAATRDDTERQGTRRVRSQAPLPVLAVAAATLGALVLPPLAGPWRRLLGDTTATGPNATELTVSGALALAVLALTWFSARCSGTVRAPFALHWFRLEQVAVLLVARPVWALACALARFDDRVIDGGVRAAAAGGRLASAFAARRIEPGIDGLVNATGGTARRLGALARRPQTGQVHLYYAQAAVLFAVLVLIVLVAG